MKRLMLAASLITSVALAQQKSVKGNVLKLVQDDEGVRVILSLDKNTDIKKAKTDVIYLENTNTSYDEIYKALTEAEKTKSEMNLSVKPTSESPLMVIKEINKAK